MAKTKVQAKGKEKSKDKEVEKNTTKSSQMIKLWLDKVPIKVIYKQMGVRYNFVNNVIHRYCKRHKVVFTTHSEVVESKKSIIQRLYFDEKMSMKDIAKKLDTHPTYVWNCVDDMRQSMK